MFYSSYLFVKKGPLAGLWLAAHWQRKLTKVMIEKTNLLKAKHAIEQPETPLALRVSGQLLLGLVRIYDKKVRYLQEDCSEAITSLKQAYRAGRPGAVDSVNLPADAQQGAHINLPDQGDDDVQIALPDIDIDELLRDHSAAQLDDDLYGIPMKKKRSRSKKKKSDAAAAEEEEETDEDSVVMSSTKQKARAADITMEDFGLSQSSHPLILGDEDLLDGIGVLRDDELEIEVGRDDAQQSRIEDEMMMPLEMEEDVPVGKADQSAINLADISIAESNRPSMIPTSPEREDDMENKYDDVKSNKRPREQLTEEEELLDIQMDVVDDDALRAVTNARVKAKPVKKQRIERVDASTEISGKDMAKWIADPSDLVRPRPTVPCTRAQRMLQDITNLPDHFNHSSTHTHLPSELTSLLTLASSRTLKKLSQKEMNVRSERARMWRSTLGHVDEDDAKTVVPDDMIEPVAEEEVVIPTESDVIVDEGDMAPLNDSLDIDATEDIPPPPQQAERDEDVQSIRSYDDSTLQADATRDEENAGAARQFFSEKSEPVEEDGNETADEAMEQDQKKQQQVGTDLSQRTKKMHSLLNKMMTKSKSTETTLDAVIQTAPKNQRHIAAIVFQQLLVLKTHDFVDVEQNKPYDDIIISQTATFKKAFTGRPIAA